MRNRTKSRPATLKGLNAMFISMRMINNQNRTDETVMEADNTNASDCGVKGIALMDDNEIHAFQPKEQTARERREDVVEDIDDIEVDVEDVVKYIDDFDTMSMISMTTMIVTSTIAIKMLMMSMMV